MSGDRPVREFQNCVGPGSVPSFETFLDHGPVRFLKIGDKRMLVIFDFGEISNIDETLKKLKRHKIEKKVLFYYFIEPVKE